MNKQTVDESITSLHASGVNISSNYLRTNGYKMLVNSARRIYSTWNMALLANGIEPVRVMTKFSDKDQVAAQYLKDFRAGVKRSQIKYQYAINKYFGSTNALESYLGLNKEVVAVTYSKEELDSKVYSILEIESERVSAAILNKYDANIVHSIRSHYGNITAYFSQLDLDFYSKPYVPFKWDASNVKRQLMRWIREGKPVNYTFVAMKHTGIIVAARKFYGGYAELFEACELNYDDFRTDTNMASFYGKQLENVFEEVLSELNCKYEREPSIEKCRPDFVLGNDWIDVKLSEWTIHISDCDTVKKYEPHCETLTIVFLRGNKSLNKLITPKTRLVNIQMYIEQLPSEKRDYFYAQLDEIERELDVKECA